MLKLIRGIAEYRQKVRPTYTELFAHLAHGQQPDALLIACSDSRVVPNTFASTDPGELFVVRNIGNIVPPCATHGGLHLSGEGPEDGPAPAAAHSEAAALEFAILKLEVRDLIICGHSHCGAMTALLDDRDRRSSIHRWLEYGEPSLARLRAHPLPNSGLSPVDQLSQANVLQQLDHLLSYPEIRKRVDAGTLRLHGWWFDIGHAEVLHFDEASGRFVVIDEQEAARLLDRFGAD